MAVTFSLMVKSISQFFLWLSDTKSVNFWPILTIFFSKSSAGNAGQFRFFGQIAISTPSMSFGASKIRFWSKIFGQILIQIWGLSRPFLVESGQFFSKMILRQEPWISAPAMTFWTWKLSGDSNLTQQLTAVDWLPGIVEALGFSAANWDYLLSL